MPGTGRSSPGQAARAGRVEVRRRFAGLCALLLALASGAASAQVVTGAPGYAAVGRLSLGPAGFCTATLIAADVAVTAAHCLFDRQGQAHPLEALSLELGLRGGKPLARRALRSVAIHPAFRPEDQPDQEGLPRSGDAALILLEAPLRDPRLHPFDPGAAPELGQRVSVMAYLRDLPGTSSLQTGCPVAERLGGFMVLSCPVDFGASGGPVFVTRQGKPQLVGIVTAKAVADGAPVTLAMPLTPVLDQLLPQIEAQRG